MTDKPIKLLFAYSSDGILRYFSWEFLITTEKLLTADIIVIDQTCGLCALNVKNVALSSFSEVEILNVGIRSYPENFGSNLALTPLSQRNSKCYYSLMLYNKFSFDRELSRRHLLL